MWPTRAVSVLWRALLGVTLAAMAITGSVGIAQARDVPALSTIADVSAVDLGPSGVLHLYTAHLPSGAAPDPDAVVSALIVIHGHPRDANRTLAAGALAATGAGRASDTVVVAPLFAVAASNDRRCRFPGNPAAQPGDALWTCASWMSGERAEGDGPTSFEALDKAVAHLAQRWPRLRTITIAGFSAGAQFVQHYIGFARPPANMRLRYVVSDPGTWLYFDPQRPVPLADGQPSGWKRCQDAACDFTWRLPDAGACPQANRWKYGIDGRPLVLGADAAAARARYAAADVSYLEGALDTGRDRGTFFRILDKSCAADLQGSYRLQRGLAYAAYDRRFMSSSHPVAIVPGCAHEVACVFPSIAARRFLFPE